MYKLNIFMVIAAVAVFMSQASAVGFDNNNPDGNRKLAHRLYRGAYEALENAKQIVSERGKQAMDKKSEDFQQWNANDYIINQFWATVTEGSSKTSFKEQLARQERDFKELWQNNNQTEEEVRKLRLDHTSFPGLNDARYRDVEALKQAAQKLFNVYDYDVRCSQKVDTASSSETREKEIAEHIAAVTLCLKTLGEDTVNKVLMNTDIQ